MRIGAFGMGSLAFRDVMAGPGGAGRANRDNAVILLYLHGGPSHLETYDLKPDAPLEYRSIFAPIPTRVPGMEICELFPLQARLADKFSLVRSLHHDVGIHSDGGIVVLTGKRPTQLDPTSRSVSEHPDFGHVTSRIRGMAESIPPYVTIPSKPYMTRPGYVGVQHTPLELGDPSAENFSPPNMKLVAGLSGERLGDRRALVAQLDRLRRDLDQSGGMGNVEEFRSLAFDLLTSPRAADAFDITREPDTLRDRYGRNLWGQSCLLARRLAEAGAGVITIFFNTPKNGQEFTNWDDHIANAGRPGHFGKYMRVRLPYMDQSLSALIEDIFQRGLDKKILVVVMGEFGRTPRLSVNSTGTGRDHWPQAYTAMVSGGGLRMGQVVGATNSKGEYPTERAYTPQDMLATVYRHLGIDHRRTLPDFFGRPIHILQRGEPIPELI